VCWGHFTVPWCGKKVVRHSNYCLLGLTFWVFRFLCSEGPLLSVFENSCLISQLFVPQIGREGPVRFKRDIGCIEQLSRVGFIEGWRRRGKRIISLYNRDLTLVEHVLFGEN
jgi:hypothetical protein